APLDPGLLRRALRRDGGAQLPAARGRATGAGQLSSVLRESELLARTRQLASGHADGHGDLGPARLSLCLDTGGDRTGETAEARSRAGHPAFLDVLCGAFL